MSEVLDKLINEGKECRKNSWAGIVIGSVTGFMFGTVDSAKTSGLSTDLASLGKNIRDPVVMKFFFRNQIQTTLVFTGMFTIYQTTRCLLMDKNLDVPVVAGVAAAAGIVPFLPNRMFRRNLPWACVLIGMDIYGGGISK